jgi:ligand-binding sensor domain-containing protein/serine phosphatase RsbU (regulator of sigma subunit)
MWVTFRKISFTIISIIALSMVSLYSFSQNVNVSFETFTMSDGLSNNSISCIFQDSKGYIWIGTSSGLNRYDGRTFILFKNDPLNPNSLSSNSINGLSEDKTGCLWIATDNGLNVYNPITGKFKKYFYNEKNINTIKNNYVYNVLVDSKGFVWVKTLRFLDKIDVKTNTVKHYEHYFDIFNPVSDHANYPIFEDSYGLIWIATNDGLNYFDSEFEQFVRFTSDESNPKSLSNSQIRCIYENAKHQLWIGTSNGFSRFDRKKKIFESFFFENPKLQKSSVNGITEDANNNLWLATEQNGLAKFNLSDKTFTFYKQSGQNDKSIPSNNVYRLIKDKSGILWIGTRFGLTKFDSKKRKFNLYRNAPNSDYLLSSNDITCMFADINENLLIGTRNDGICLVNRLKRSVKYYNVLNRKNQSDFIYTIYKTHNKNILVGTETQLEIFNESRDLFEPYLTKTNCKNFQVLDKKRVNTLCEDASNNLWIGTNQGLFKYSPKKGIIEAYYYDYTLGITIPSNTINSIYEDKVGAIWIGTDNGLAKYNPSKDVFIRIGNDSKTKQGLSNIRVNCIEGNEFGVLWIGTAAGLNRYDVKTGLFSYITEREGLLNDQIQSIVKDGPNLWLGTNKGIAKYITTSHKVRSYILSDGLQGFEYNLNSNCVSPRGELFFGGVNGFNSFFPNQMEDNMLIPNIEITSFVSFNNSGKSIHLIDDKREIFLHSDTKSILIEFASLEYSFPKQNKYKYCMEGLDNKWTDADNRNYASYSNMPPGEYTFKVIGSNCDDVWNEKGTSIKITIETPIWRNKWTYFAYFIFISLIIFGVIEIRTRSLRRANKVLHEKELISIEIAKQKEEVSIKNKNIMDSITYAQRIQLAIMPSISKFKRLIPESFILYNPKDIVSGDFYWITEIGDKLFIAAVDCTGHGVPGAFMSIIGYDLLRNITKERGIHRPSEVLDQLNKSLIELLTKNNIAVGQVKDGMDITLCVFHKSKGIVEFSGALNPLYIIRDNKIVTVKGDRYSVGLGNEHPDENFKNHIIKLELGDRLYIFSDGYSDQFGGPSGKKMKFRRFRHLLLSIHEYPFEQQQKYLEDHFVQWMGPHEQVDDILIIGMSFDYYIEQIPEDSEYHTMV